MTRANLTAALFAASFIAAIVIGAIGDDYRQTATRMDAKIESLELIVTLAPDLSGNARRKAIRSEYGVRRNQARATANALDVSFIAMSIAAGLTAIASTPVATAAFAALLGVAGAAVAVSVAAIVAPAYLLAAYEAGAALSMGVL